MKTEGDGNCLCHALSKAFFNEDTKHLEIRVRIIIEAIIHKDKYLCDDCLERGATFLHGNADLPTVFMTFSGYYTPGQKITFDTITAIYCLEVHGLSKPNSYMGLWQLANCNYVDRCQKGWSTSSLCSPSPRKAVRIMKSCSKINLFSFHFRLLLPIFLNIINIYNNNYKWNILKN